MDVVDLAGDQLDATTEGVDGFFKLLDVAVRKTNVVVDIGLKEDLGFVKERLFEDFDAGFVVLMSVLRNTQFVKD